MAKYRINVAMDIRAYGYTEVEADSIEAAQAQVTHRHLANHFQPHGAGADDFDYSHPRAVWLAEYSVDDGEPVELEIDLPDEPPSITEGIL